MKKLLLSAGIFLMAVLPSWGQTPGEKNYLTRFDFLGRDFASPEMKFAPFTRWWWPGNAVTNEELTRELQVFADNHFGGVEIQPVSPMVLVADLAKVFTFDTPSYYEHLKTALQEAAKRGLTVDLTDGSGWPPGGGFISAEEGNQSLQYGMTDLPAGNSQPIKLPRTKRGDRPSAKFVGLVAVQLDKDGKTILKSKDISSSVKDSTFVYNQKEAGWKAIALWEVPCMEQNMLYANPNRGYVLNHFDSKILDKYYTHMFDNADVKPFQSKPVRAIFDDSYEFKVDRHFSDLMVQTFKENRGYDPIPYLPGVIWYGYNNMYARNFPAPEFNFGKENWRLMYDYDLTVSDCIRKDFLRSTKDWTESRGMLHRTQTYGLNMDIMGAAGDASIPELETMLFSDGQEGGMKIITSAGQLYNKPIVSCESFVHIKRAYNETPQKMRLTVDKLLTAGVNQMNFHGTSYQVKNEKTPKEGWYMFFYSPYSVNFSSDIREGTQFWKYQNEINQYIQRSQYVMRSGRSASDVLIYYPFLNYTGGINPTEILVDGYLKDNEPPLDTNHDLGAYDDKVCAAWLNSIQPLLEELNERSITWSWVNDESLRVAKANADGSLDVRGNHYEGLILFNLPYMQLPTAEYLNAHLTQARILLVGDAPSKQPSFKDYAKNDTRTAQLTKGIAQWKNATRIAVNGELDGFVGKMKLPLLNAKQTAKLRYGRRLMSDGSLMQMYWNFADATVLNEIQIQGSYRYAYVLNAEDGTIWDLSIKNQGVTLELPALSARFLYLTNTALKSNGAFAYTAPRKQVTNLNQWTITSGDVTLENVPLMDWKYVDQLRHSSQEGIYKTTFKWKSGKAILDLGTAYYSAEVTVNGKRVGERCFKPFVFDITDFVKEGENTLEIKVMPSIYNDYVNRGQQGDKYFTSLAYKGYMSQGLIGPVNLLTE